MQVMRLRVKKNPHMFIQELQVSGCNVMRVMLRKRTFSGVMFLHVICVDWVVHCQFACASEQKCIIVHLHVLLNTSACPLMLSINMTYSTIPDLWV